LTTLLGYGDTAICYVDSPDDCDETESGVEFKLCQDDLEGEGGGCGEAGCDEFKPYINGTARVAAFIVANAFCFFGMALAVMCSKASEYKSTFFSATSAKTYIYYNFWKSNNDFLKCEATCVARHLMPPQGEIVSWLEDWDVWESKMDDWFVINRELLLLNIPFEALGKKWLYKHFWTGKPDELKIHAVLAPPECRPPDEEIMEWLAEGWKTWENDMPEWLDDKLFLLSVTLRRDLFPESWFKDMSMFHI
jgi:hypothetical protein